MDKHLHIITHDIPWPVSHGGFVDIYYKLVALYEAGIRIHLHCFTDGRSLPVEVSRYCYSVDEYKRIKGSSSLSFRVPYIISSRSNEQLFRNLLKDDHPILFEGLHTTCWLKKFQGRKCFIRMHNMESIYYLQLAKTEKNLFKKFYFIAESFLLKRFEHSVIGKALLLTVSSSDAAYYQKIPGVSARFLPVFLPWQSVTSLPGKGTFCLYHGNLSVSENEKAAEWLLKKIFSRLDIPLVIAGKDPSSSLKRLAEKRKNTCLIVNPSQNEMQDLLQKAHINLIPSFNRTGVKLKLLNALYNGRHCIVNSAAADGAEIKNAVHVENTIEGFREKITELFNSEFTESELRNRNEILNAVYNTNKLTKELTALIY